MNHTKTPAARPTAESLRNAFLQSRKRHLILTGSRGSGKTTLLNEFLNLYCAHGVPEGGLPGFSEHGVPDGEFPGFITYAVRESADGIYTVPPSSVQICDCITKKTAVIGRPSNGAMQSVKEGFLSVGLDSIRRALRHSSPFVRIDEIGFLEESCPEFCTALWKLFDEKRVFAVVRGQRLPFLDRLRSRGDVFVYNLSDCELCAGQAAAVVLASGESRRFGSNKLLAGFCGEPLLSRTLTLVTDSPFCDRIAVTRTPAVQSLCDERGFPCILHQEPLLSDTIRIGLQTLLSDTSRQPDACIFLQGDQPLLTSGSIRALIHAYRCNPCMIHRLSFGGRPGSPVLFPRIFFEELLHLPPDCGGSAVVRKYPHLVHLTEARAAYELLDADTPEALSKLRRLVTRGNQAVTNQIINEGSSS